jgi:hypothetical protein
MACGFLSRRFWTAQETLLQILETLAKGDAQ